jgi:TM2 domain-containing membrane protein YozV
VRSKLIAYLLWGLGFVLVCGIHRFYVGKWGTGILWLCTGGLFLVGQIIDAFLIPNMVDMANMKSKVDALTPK